MNEQIQKLVTQAKQSVPAGLAPEQWLEAYHTKFAELIVKECAKVINADIEYQIKDGIISNVHGLNQARNLIKEHFGVEE